MIRPARAGLATALSLALLLIGAAGCTRTDSSTGRSAAGSCAKDTLRLVTHGRLTIGTDSPASEPWYKNDDPADGQGYEAAVAYAVAEDLGFRRDEVKWTKVAFNDSYKPGPKKFDFDINQISITADRAKSVTFSDGYYTVNQAVVALDDSPIANLSTIAELRNAKLGAQVGTTGLTFIDQVVRPRSRPVTFSDTDHAKQAMTAHHVDGIVTNLPTAFYLTSAVIENSRIVGQFEPQGGSTEQFGLLFEKNNPLVGCVNQALTELRSTGELQRLEDTWLAESAGAPRLG
jgi:polar amino acid transport system substrate-binding protein